MCNFDKTSSILAKALATTTGQSTNAAARATITRCRRPNSNSSSANIATPAVVADYWDPYALDEGLAGNVATCVPEANPVGGAQHGVVAGPLPDPATLTASLDNRSMAPLSPESLYGSGNAPRSPAPLLAAGNAPPSVWADLDTLDRLIFELEAGNGGMTTATPPPPPPPLAVVGPLHYPRSHIASAPERRGSSPSVPACRNISTPASTVGRRSSGPSDCTGNGGTIFCPTTGI
uniref:Uncharacterized protein n=1 Tax=Timema poppense TaxID=170557 RepID=A0A7R9D9U6_TIMPO|nr:unnamed protein product [Timema poppensis]